MAFSLQEMDWLYKIVEKVAKDMKPGNYELIQGFHVFQNDQGKTGFIPRVPGVFEAQSDQILGRFVLEEGHPDYPEKGTVKTAVKKNRYGFDVEFRGYGTKDQENGPVIHVELYAGELVLYVWDDITQEEPRKIILSGALEEHRDG